MMLKVQFSAIFGEANVDLAATQYLLRTQNQSNPELTLVSVPIIYY